jgi:uncharacterized protein (PEP-CTERM system associated)
MAITSRRWAAGLLRPAAGRCTILAIVLVSARAAAADWTVAPTLRLRESYSDNVQLASGARASGEFITEINPAVAIHGNGPRLKLDLLYGLQQLFYTHQPDTLHHQLSATANAELLDDWLFLDARSSISRQNVSAFGPQAFDNLQRTDNQSTVRANRISPFVRHHFRSFATAELRYSHETVSSSNNFFDVGTDALLFNLAGDNRGRGWSWDARYYAKRSEDPVLGPIRSHNESLALRLPVTSRLGLFARGGYESEGYQADTSQRPEGRFWSVGANWRPSRRSSLTVSGGKRFFGDTYSLKATQRNRRSTWSLSYDEDITTSSSQFLRLGPANAFGVLDELWGTRIVDPQLRRQAISAFLNFTQLLGPDVGAINYFSHTYFLQKQLSLSVAALTPKSTLLLGLAATKRTAQSTSSADNVLLLPFQLVLNENTEQWGAHAGWHLRLSERTGAKVSARYDHIKSVSAGRSDDNLALSVGLSRILRPKVTGTVDLRHMRHTSTSGGAGYRENGISASLTFQL